MLRSRDPSVAGRIRWCRVSTAHGGTRGTQVGPVMGPTGPGVSKLVLCILGLVYNHFHLLYSVYPGLPFSHGGKKGVIPVNWYALGIHMLTTCEDAFKSPF